MCLAGSRPRFVWEGVVDGIVDIQVHSRDVRVKAVEGAPAENSLWRLTKALPDETVPVELKVLESRGYVHLVSEPALTNGYTLVIRIEDRQEGRSRYRFSVDWESGLEQLARAAHSPVTVTAELPISPLEAKRRADRPGREKSAKDIRWVTDGETLKISGRAIWAGRVNGTARIAVSERGASVLAGDANGRLASLGPSIDMKKAGDARVLSLSEAAVTIADAATARNGYTLTIEITGGTGPTSFELAW
jgi:hypothetical protein